LNTNKVWRRRYELNFPSKDIKEELFGLKKDILIRRSRYLSCAQKEMDSIESKLDRCM